MMKSHIIKIPPIFFPTVYLKLVHILKTHHIYKPIQCLSYDNALTNCSQMKLLSLFVRHKLFIVHVTSQMMLILRVSFIKDAKLVNVYHSSVLWLDFLAFLYFFSLLFLVLFLFYLIKNFENFCLYYHSFVSKFKTAFAI